MSLDCLPEITLDLGVLAHSRVNMNGVQTPAVQISKEGGMLDSQKSSKTLTI